MLLVEIAMETTYHKIHPVVYTWCFIQLMFQNIFGLLQFNFLKNKFSLIFGWIQLQSKLNLTKSKFSSRKFNKNKFNSTSYTKIQFKRTGTKWDITIYFDNDLFK